MIGVFARTVLRTGDQPAPTVHLWHQPLDWRAVQSVVLYQGDSQATWFPQWPWKGMSLI